MSAFLDFFVSLSILSNSLILNKIEFESRLYCIDIIADQHFIIFSNNLDMIDDF